MTHYAELGSCDRHPVRDWKLVAVGWLDSAAPEFAGFRKGLAPPGFLEKLAELAKVEQPNLFRGAGYHKCNIDECKVSKPVMFGLRLGSREMFVPAPERNGAVYCSPDLILHYIQVHQYLPPEEFVRAALATAPAAVPQLTDINLS